MCDLYIWISGLWEDMKSSIIYLLSRRQWKRREEIIENRRSIATRSITMHQGYQQVSKRRPHKERTKRPTHKNTKMKICRRKSSERRNTWYSFSKRWSENKEANQGKRRKSPIPNINSLSCLICSFIARDSHKFEIYLYIICKDRVEGVCKHWRYSMNQPA